METKNDDSLSIALYPTSDQIEEFLEAQDHGPVVMLNLLRLKPEAGDPDAGMSGEKAYARYVEKMIPFIESKGGRVIWSGRIDAQMIGEGGTYFHTAALVEYPSKKAFVEIAMDPYVQEIGIHRAAGLEGQWLLASTTSP